MRYEKITPFRVMDLVRKAQAYDDTVHFEIGQPDLPPAPGVKRALMEAVESGRFAYTESLGLQVLREKISTHYRHDYGLEVDPGRILLTPGTSIAFMVAYELLLPAGGTLAVSDPSYPCYKNFAYMVDAEPLFIPTGPENGYQLSPEMLEGHAIDLLHISSPSNPTGTLYSPEHLEALSDYCLKKKIGFISDELYHGLVYGKKAHSALEYGDHGIVINGFSKYFCMPGLRLGWMVLPEQLVRPAEIIAQNLYLSAPTLSQYAALNAFDYDYLSTVRETFRQRRDYLYEALSVLFPIEARPDGAFYIWCDVSGYTDDAMALAEALLETVHVAVTPGIDFGPEKGKRYLRFAYTREIPHMQEGIESLKRFFRPGKAQR